MKVTTSRGLEITIDDITVEDEDNDENNHCKRVFCLDTESGEVLGEAFLEIDPTKKHAHLDEIEIDENERLKGLMRLIHTEVEKVARASGFENITVIPGPIGEKPLSQDELDRIYKKLGYRDYEFGKMIKSLRQ